MGDLYHFPFIMTQTQCLGYHKIRGKWFYLSTVHLETAYGLDFKNIKFPLTLCIGRGPSQDVPYDIILWYVSKIVYSS